MKVLVRLKGCVVWGTDSSVKRVISKLNVKTLNVQYQSVSVLFLEVVKTNYVR